MGTEYDKFIVKQVTEAKILKKEKSVDPSHAARNHFSLYQALANLLSVVEEIPDFTTDAPAHDRRKAAMIDARNALGKANSVRFTEEEIKNLDK